MLNARRMFIDQHTPTYEINKMMKSDLSHFRVSILFGHRNRCVAYYILHTNTSEHEICFSKSKKTTTTTALNISIFS